jgi:hypothetical protein
LGVGGLWQSRKHLQRNHHHCATLQGPVRGVDNTFQGDTSRKLRDWREPLGSSSSVG